MIPTEQGIVLGLGTLLLTARPGRRTITPNG
jgi:hypothetical protein